MLLCVFHDVEYRFGALIPMAAKPIAVTIHKCDVLGGKVAPRDL